MALRRVTMTTREDDGEVVDCWRSEPEDVMAWRIRRPSARFFSFPSFQPALQPCTAEPELPAPTGASPVGRMGFHWTDASPEPLSAIEGRVAR